MVTVFCCRNFGNERQEGLGIPEATQQLFGSWTHSGQIIERHYEDVPVHDASTFFGQVLGDIREHGDGLVVMAFASTLEMPDKQLTDRIRTTAGGSFFLIVTAPGDRDDFANWVASATLNAVVIDYHAYLQWARMRKPTRWLYEVLSPYGDPKRRRVQIGTAELNIRLWRESLTAAP